MLKSKKQYLLSPLGKDQPTVVRGRRYRLQEEGQQEGAMTPKMKVHPLSMKTVTKIYCRSNRRVNPPPAREEQFYTPWEHTSSEYLT